MLWFLLTKYFFTLGGLNIALVLLTIHPEQNLPLFCFEFWALTYLIAFLSFLTAALNLLIIFPSKMFKLVHVIAKCSRFCWVYMFRLWSFTKMSFYAFSQSLTPGKSNLHVQFFVLVVLTYLFSFFSYFFLKSLSLPFSSFPLLNVELLYVDLICLSYFFNLWPIDRRLMKYLSFLLAATLKSEVLLKQVLPAVTNHSFEFIPILVLLSRQLCLIFLPSIPGVPCL